MTALARYRYSNCRCEEPSSDLPFRPAAIGAGRRSGEQNRVWPARADQTPRVPVAAKRQWPGYSNLIWDVELKLMFGPIDPPDTRCIKPESGVMSVYL
jgi:hypothetical protein